MRTNDELGPYRIVRRIAVGGMAEIYLARQRGIEGLERTVVLKQILEKHEQNEEFVTMFLDEARLLAALSHPNIAQVLDLGKTGDTHYLVMEYVRGPTLGTMLAAAQKRGMAGLPERPALGIALEVAEALDYAHEVRDDLGRPLGIVHRDLNPANVVVSYDGHAKLIDFGIAKAATKVYETRVGVIKGTYGYIAPEALTGSAPVDRRADVFALGILLYEMLVGQHPFDTSDHPNVLDRIVEARYKRPREVRRDIPVALDRLIARCLVPHPEARPSSVGEFIRSLTEHMGERGIVPTQTDLGALASDLVPDSEGPVPVRRPTANQMRPLLPRDPSRLSSRPPPDSSAQRFLDEKTDKTGPPVRPDGTHKVPTAPQPPRSELDDDSVTVRAATLPSSRDMAPPPRAASQRRPSELLLFPAATPPSAAVTIKRKRRKKGRWRALILPATVAGVFAFTFTWWLERNTSSLPPRTRGAPDRPARLEPAVPAPVEPAAVTPSLEVISDPPGATVRIDGVVQIATTPTTIVWGERDRMVVTVEAPGHVPQSRVVSNGSSRARFVLEPLPGEARSELPAPPASQQLHPRERRR